ncbi:MAG: prepilin-type N-terminal cleavage/methylation domain-containing protein [Deltaproteobacteria bacterium]|nr:prepilin-type N-terminal cleavage/methylation domain-containing protein [Deltaproteobacteria bacterium]
MQPVRKDNKGYTIIEVLVAVSIFSIGLLGLATMQISAIRTNGFAYRANVATLLAQDLLEDYKRLGYDGIPSTGNYTDNNPLNERGEHDSAGVYNRTWTVADNGWRKTITVTVAWTDISPHSVTLSSQINQ